MATVSFTAKQVMELIILGIKNENYEAAINLAKEFIAQLKAFDSKIDNRDLREQVVFICGPYRGKTIADIAANIERAETYAQKYWGLGYTVICPHLNTRFFDIITNIPDEAFLSGCKELVRRCDILVTIPKWRQSSGSVDEYDLAVSLDKVIIHEEGGA